MDDEEDDLPTVEPCPWCGEAATVEGDSGHATDWVECCGDDCHAQGPLKSGKREAIEVWNIVARSRKVEPR